MATELKNGKTADGGYALVESWPTLSGVTGDEWNEAEHPRGQPENAGEFAEKVGNSLKNIQGNYKPEFKYTGLHPPFPVASPEEDRVASSPEVRMMVKNEDYHMGWLDLNDPKLRITQTEVSKERVQKLAKHSNFEYSTLGAFKDPIIVVNVGDKKVVADGHHRITTAKLGGMTEVPVVYVDSGYKPKPQKRPLTAGVTRKVLFEVAPDPDNKAVKAQWDRLNPQVRTKISAEVLKDVLPEVLDKTRVDAKMHMQYGGYGADTNPSVSLVLGRGTSEEQADILTRSLGAILDQQSMMRVSKKPFSGSNEMGAVVIKVPKNITFKAVENLYNTLRASVTDDMGNPLVNGHTTDAGRMIILVDKGTEEVLATRIHDALKGLHDVGHDTLNVSWPEKGEDNYGFARKDQSGRRLPGSSIREWINSVHAKTTGQLQRHLKQYEREQAG